MNEAEKMATEAKDDNFDLTMANEELKKMSGELYNILSPYCTGEALTIVRGVTTFEGFVAWKRLHKKFSPKTMARAIRLMTEVASPKTVREFQEVEEAITSWENKVKKLESECGEKLSDTMKTAIVTGMMPSPIHDFVYTNVDDTTMYLAVVDKLRSWAGNNLAMMSGLVPMDRCTAGSRRRRRKTGKDSTCRRRDQGRNAIAAAGGGTWPANARRVQESPKGKGRTMAVSRARTRAWRREEPTKVSEAERAVTSRVASWLDTSRASVCTKGPRTQWRTTSDAPCPTSRSVSGECG